MSQELFQTLDEFQQQLSATVAVMQQQVSNRMQVIQAETTAIRLDAQQLLQTHQQQRCQNQLQVMQNLAEFVERMRGEVEADLSELEAMRHDRAYQLQQSLRQSHEQRKADMKRLFDQLAAFRSELTAYCAEIRQQVWGSSQPASISQPTPPQLKTQFASRPAGQTSGQLPERSATRPSARPPARLVARVRSPQPDKSKAIPGSSPRKATSVTQTKPPIAKPNLTQLEQTIFNHLTRVQQTTLAEVESTFALNRFAAVDALRSLIKKGCIVQRDHVYRIQQ
jgi:gas vesicle protein